MFGIRDIVFFEQGTCLGAIPAPFCRVKGNRAGLLGVIFNVALSQRHQVGQLGYQDEQGDYRDGLFHIFSLGRCNQW